MKPQELGPRPVVKAILFLLCVPVFLAGSSQISGQAERKNGRRYYDLRTLKKNGDLRLKKLVDAIKDNIKPDSWEQEDCDISAHEAGILMVRHTDEVHGQIRQLVRALKEEDGDRIIPRDGGTEKLYITTWLDIPGTALKKVMKSRFGNNSWKKEDTSFLAGDVYLRVRNSPDVLSKIDRFLEGLRAGWISPPQPYRVEDFIDAGAKRIEKIISALQTDDVQSAKHQLPEKSQGGTINHRRITLLGMIKTHQSLSADKPLRAMKHWDEVSARAAWYGPQLNDLIDLLRGKLDDTGTPSTLVEDLNASSFKKRERATSRLRKFGILAWPTLKPRMDTENAEVRSRIRAIADLLRLKWPSAEMISTK